MAAPAAPPMLAWMQTLADATRLRLLRVLETHELTVAELCQVVQAPQSTVSRHLKVLSDHGWVSSRREGTSRLYRMATGELAAPGKRLWHLLREQAAATPTAEQDDRRLATVLAERQSRSQEFFSSAAGQWDQMRGELFGDRFDLLALAALLEADWTIGDLGCGTGQVAATVAPWVRRVVAVDESSVMLKNARQRLKAFDNVEVRRGNLTALPLDDGELHTAVITLVLHHVPEPAAALAEVGRTIRPGGRVLIVDMFPHERAEYAQQMGHVWLGFDAEQIGDWLDKAGFGPARLRPLPPTANTKGPGLFAATATRH